jgi:hypothetical protein
MAVIGCGLGWAVAGRPTPAATPKQVVAAPVAAVQRSLPPRLRYRSHLAVGLTPLDEATLKTTAAAASSAPAAAYTGMDSAGSSMVPHVVSFNGGRTFFAASTPTPTTFAAGGGGTDATTTSSATDSTTTVSVPTGPPIQISGVRTVSLSPFGATIAWQTSEAVSSRVAYGFDLPTLWTAATVSTEHTAVVSGLGFGKTYRLWVTAHAADGRTAESDFVLTTPMLSQPVVASTDAGALELNGQPFFPTIVWKQCPDGYAGNLAAGIDLFMGNGCGSADEAVKDLAGRAFAVADASARAGVPGAVGSFLPDEADTFLPGDLTTAQAAQLVPAAATAPRFLTLTSHFFSGAAPLPQGRGMYPPLMGNADILGFDLYPLQNWCRYDDFGPVYDAQRELVQQGGGKPTYQWIEARKLDCSDPSLDVSPQTVHAETWLAIAGGAHAIAYFPNQWRSDVGDQIARDRQQIDSLVAALVEPNTDAASTSGVVKVGVRVHNDAIYVIAVNSSRNPSNATITVPGLGDRTLISLDGLRTATAAGGAFTENFDGLEAQIWIAAPSR